MRLPIDTALIPADKLPKNVLDHLQEITSQFEVTRDLAKQNIKAAQERNKRYHDRGAAKPTFYIGQQVVINNVNKTKGLNPKLQAKKVGPYYISDVNEDNNTYLLRDCQTHNEQRSRIHAKRLTAFVDANIRDIQPPEDIHSTSETDEDVQGNHQQAAANSHNNQTPNPQSPSQHPPNQTQLAPQTDTTRTQSDTPVKSQNPIVANHELLGAIDPLFPPTRGFSWPVNVYIGHTELIRSWASVSDCFALPLGTSGCDKTGEGSNLIG